MINLMTGLFAIFSLLLLVSVPHWPHSRDWGYGPSCSLAVIGVLLLIDWL